MYCPGDGSNSSKPDAFPFVNAVQWKECCGENEKGDGRRGVEEKVGAMIGGGTKGERPIIQRIGHALEWTVKIRRRGIDKKEMLKAFWN
jgi:hypothetical protein